VAIALGSNLGVRERFLAQARVLIGARMGAVVGISSVYETEPVGPAGQQRYLNQVVVIESHQLPEALLDHALAIERELGRERTHRWGPRTIDVDLLLYGDEAILGCGLTLPHPRLHERPFVLVPLAEVLPEWVHPQRGESARQMCRALGDEGVVRHGERAGR